MKIQHLETLAAKFTNDDFKRYDWMKEEHRDHYYQSNLKELIDVRQALLDGRYYTFVESVAKSGMSRVIKIGYIADNQWQGVSDEIYKLAGCDKNRRIGGCGMDMLFAAQYNLFCALCPDYTYQKDMPRYNSI